MQRSFICIFITGLLAFSIIITTGTPVQAKKDSKHRFTWGDPGPTAPVLHPGSVHGAGMLSEPLLEIGPYMEAAIEDGAFPGAVTFVARKGHIVQHNAYGHAYLYEDYKGNTADQPIKMSNDTIFDLASISKIFTSTAAMILYEQGFFKLDDPVADYIPEFAENGKENVTIKQLMTHTSGFTPWIPLHTIGDNREDRLQYVYQYPLNNSPGSTYTYSDLNMITLGALIERLSGQRLDEFVYENITKPLKMNDTMYNPPESLIHRIAATEYQPGINRGLVWGEVHDESAWVLDGIAGHAGVFSSAEDLGKFAHMFINDGRYDGKRILKPETVELLVENQIPEFPGNDHGLGWEISQAWYMDGLSGPASIGHTGYTGTSLVVNMENDTVAILLTNRVHPSRDTVSTNTARKQLARLVANAIPVATPKSDGTWYAGHGDLLENRTLTVEVNLEDDATLSYDTWYRIENYWDFGYLEVSSDGEHWNTVKDAYSGSSKDWLHEQIEIPANTTQIRFRYSTDVGGNERGWYVSNLKLTDSSKENIPFEVVSNGWVERNY
ncbi:serine hydrolase domain-containing protein [Oceanobacillus rekensis]|uniref:serine hydrolase domain-containing protein n=1 Tax=Oceanobacillus rekensis TaxID=937927 RepID=UPI000B431E75|nr:serine hydrolase domain-containing protein [Oceanobacillus rekensis]